MKKFITAGIIVVLFGLFIYTKPVFDLKLKTSALIASVTNLSSSELREKLNILERENNFLKEELRNATGEEIKSVKIYSSYPFNSRSEISIASGEKDGIKVGDIATYGGDTLVGRITRVFESSSIVTTIFDPTQEIAVRIGEFQVDALLRGGNEIELTLIPHDEPIEVGDKVVTASEGYPYGLEIGIIREIKEGEEGVFKVAILDPNFRLKKIRDVIILR